MYTRKNTNSFLMCGLLAGFIGIFNPSTTLAGTTLIFTDITDTAGVGLPGTLNESLAWGDYDNDGDQDLYLTNDGPNKLFRNDGGGTFTEVASIVGVIHDTFSVGAAFGDLDNDGDLDLIVVSFSGDDALFRNDGPIGPGGEYVFTDVAVSAGILGTNTTRGITLFDYDRDGLLDIYINSFSPGVLFHNLGNLQFQNVASALGVVSTNVGSVGTDIDNNGWIDLFTGNRDLLINNLYLNETGTFTDIAVAAGITETGLGMGVLSFDYDNDLDMDLYWTSWPGGNPPQPNALYENIDGTSFSEVAAASGTEDPLGWGISCNTGDIDNDGWEDFFVTNGFSVDSTANVLFRNNGNKTFSDVTSVIGGADYDGRGIAFADFDNDGDVDFCITGGPSDNTRLWRNDTITTHHWVVLELVGTISNRSAIGARIEITTDVRTTVKEVSGGAGRGSQNSLPVEFGLGNATEIQNVTIRWPSGKLQSLSSIIMDQYHTIVELETLVPTVSDWGLMIMMLLLVIVATRMIQSRIMIKRASFNHIG